MRVEVAAADGAEDGGAEPDSRQDWGAPPTGGRQQREQPERLAGRRQRKPELVGPTGRRSRHDRVAVEAVAQDGVEPIAQPRRAGGGDRDGHERARDKHGNGHETALPLTPEQVHDRREPGIEGGLLDEKGAPGQRTGAGES